MVVTNRRSPASISVRHASSRRITRGPDENRIGLPSTVWFGWSRAVPPSRKSVASGSPANRSTRRSSSRGSSTRSS